MKETIRFNGISKIHKGQLRSTGLLGVPKDSALEKLIRVIVASTIKERFSLTIGGRSGTMTFKGKVQDGKVKRTIEVQMMEFKEKEE
jgi:hypothetical protein